MVNFAHYPLELEGFKDDIEAIDALIRHALVFGSSATKAQIEAAVAEALKHNDEPADESSPLSDQA